MKNFLIGSVITFFVLASAYYKIKSDVLNKNRIEMEDQFNKLTYNSDYEAGLRQGYMKGCLRGVDRTCWFNDCAVISLTEIKNKSCYGKEVD